MAENAPIIINVDDDRTTREAVTRVLRGEGFEVREATTGKEALELAAGSPALIVLDAKLPDLSGNEVIRRLKGDPATASVALLQLADRPLDGPGSEAGAGADGYLSRPVDPRELVSLVRSLLRLRRAEAEPTRQTARVVERESEVRRLEALAANPPAAVTATLYGSAPLREGHPATFAELVAEFSALLDLAMEQREFKVTHSLAERLRALGERLGALHAGPRDVVGVYSAALKQRAAAAPAARAPAYVDEGRLLALELMGNLVAYYRLRSVEGVGCGPPQAPARDRPGDSQT
jgi:DNA-binding response OmpR family regulator